MEYLKASSGEGNFRVVRFVIGDLVMKAHMEGRGVFNQWTGV
jgi:hypothetical protein